MGLLSIDNVIFYFHLFTTIPSRDVARDRPLEKRSLYSLPLIQISSLRRNKDVFTLVICNPLRLLPRYTINRVPVTAPHLPYCKHKGRIMTIPLDTKTFLYCFTSPGRPHIATELRLRVVPSDDPVSFESGFDLLKSNGQPWSRLLFVLSKCFTLYEKLREERFVSEDLHELEVLSTFPPIVLPKSQLHYTLNDAFIIEFSHHKTCINVVNEQGIEGVHLLGAFCKSTPRIFPYTGAYISQY